MSLQEALDKIKASIEESNKEAAQGLSDLKNWIDDAKKGEERLKGMCDERLDSLSEKIGKEAAIDVMFIGTLMAKLVLVREEKEIVESILKMFGTSEEQ